MFRLSLPPVPTVRVAARGLAAAALALCANVGAVSGAVDDDDFALDTTADLADLCGVADDAPGAVPAGFACRAFIEATMQYHDAISERKQLQPLTCPPAGTTIADGRAAFVAWSKANAGNAKLMGELPVVGLVRALAAKYPCK